MPFTISHAAAVLPFSRLLARWRLLSAATIGAMAPDFGFFFPWHVRRLETHSAIALVTFCLPVGLAAYWVFQYLIKTPLMELLPEGPYARWRPFASPADFRSIRQWLLAACGVFGGAVTHLVWDAFTHEGARGVRMLPVLDEPFVEIGGHHMMGVRLMQDGSSLLGLVVVFAIIAYGLRRGREQPVPKRPLRLVERCAWVMTYAVSTVAATAAWSVWARKGASLGHSVTPIVNNLAVASLRGLATVVLVLSLCLWLRLLLRPRP